MKNILLIILLLFTSCYESPSAKDHEIPPTPLPSPKIIFLGTLTDKIVGIQGYRVGLETESNEGFRISSLDLDLENMGLKAKVAFENSSSQCEVQTRLSAKEFSDLVLALNEVLICSYSDSPNPAVSTSEACFAPYSSYVLTTTRQNQIGVAEFGTSYGSGLFSCSSSVFSKMDPIIVKIIKKELASCH